MQGVLGIARKTTNMRRIRGFLSSARVGWRSLSTNTLTTNTLPKTISNIDTIFATAGCDESDPLTGAVVPPLYLSTTFERDKETLQNLGGFNYIRCGNPTRNLLEQFFAKIEDGSEAFAFSSGMQACTSIVMSLPGRHVLLPNDLYHGVYEIVATIFTKWGATYERIDMTDRNIVQSRLEAVRDGKASTAHKKSILWLETPSNPKGKVSDIQDLSTLARAILGDNNVCTVVDSTWATPYLTRPLSLGADVVMHSTTKYVSGHSDVLGGVVVLGKTSAATSLLNELRIVHSIGGGVCAPLESYLCLRGLRTLPVRMRTHCSSAMTLANRLAAHPSVSVVHYPGLETHPQHSVAARQMGGLFGGMLSFELKDVGEQEALQVVRNVTKFKRATSLGGTESLIEHRASIEGAFRVSPPTLLRVSVGLEDVDDLSSDLTRAIDAATGRVQ